MRVRNNKWLKHWAGITHAMWQEGSSSNNSVRENKLKEELTTEAKGPGLSPLLDILSSQDIVPTPTWIA